MSEVGRAVERVDHPQRFSIRVDFRCIVRLAFFTQNRVVRKSRSNDINNCPFRFDVRVGNEIAILLRPHFNSLPEIPGKNPAPDLRRLSSNFQFTHTFPLSVICDSVGSVV